jgi:hypothetical protein
MICSSNFVSFEDGIAIKLFLRLLYYDDSQVASFFLQGNHVSLRGGELRAGGRVRDRKVEAASAG